MAFAIPAAPGTTAIARMRSRWMHLALLLAVALPLLLIALDLSFLDPDEWLTMRQLTRGDFDGIGAVLEPFGPDVRVVRPIEDSPAFKAGMKSKDLIVSGLKAAPDGTYTQVFTFAGNAEGSSPTATLVLATDGNLYGTAQYGGQYNKGAIFRMTPVR